MGQPRLNRSLRLEKNLMEWPLDTKSSSTGSAFAGPATKSAWPFRMVVCERRTRSYVRTDEQSETPKVERKYGEPITLHSARPAPRPGRQSVAGRGLMQDIPHRRPETWLNSGVHPVSHTTVRRTEPSS